MPQPNWTEQDLRDTQARMGGKGGVDGTHKARLERSAKPGMSGPIAGSNPAPSLPHRYAPYRSKLERAWANYLQGLLMLGTITGYFYEPLNLRLPGKKNFYKPDFLVTSPDGLTFHEVKGRNKSDDRSLVKIKTAAGITPWAKFVLVKRIGGQWEERVIR